jgi:WD40 repeat protein
MITLWSAASGKELRRLPRQSFYVVSLAYSPDGKTLATGSYGKIVKLWNAVSGKKIRTLTGQSGPE